MCKLAEALWLAQEDRTLWRFELCIDSEEGRKLENEERGERKREREREREREWRKRESLNQRAKNLICVRTGKPSCRWVWWE